MADQYLLIHPFHCIYCGSDSFDQDGEVLSPFDFLRAVVGEVDIDLLVILEVLGCLHLLFPHCVGVGPALEEDNQGSRSDVAFYDVLKFGHGVMIIE